MWWPYDTLHRLGAYFVRQIQPTPTNKHAQLSTIQIDFTAAFDAITRSSAYIDPAKPDADPPHTLHQRTTDAYTPSHPVAIAARLAADAHSCK